MEDNTVSNSKELREKFLAVIGYIDVALPTAGNVRIHPYLSAGAMGAYVSFPDDPEAAFQVMFAHSREEKTTTAPTLTAEDADIIALLYSEKEGFLDGYTTAKATSPPFVAFAQAIQNSDLWRGHLETQRHMKDMFDSHSRQIEAMIAVPRGIQSTFDNFSKQVASMRTFAMPDFIVPDLSAFAATRTIALEATSFHARVDLLGIDSISKTLAAGAARWAELTQSIAKFPDYSGFVRDNTQYLDGLILRAHAAESLLKPHASVFASFEKLAEVLRVPNYFTPESLGFTKQLFADSESIVRSVGSFFSTPPLSRVPNVQPSTTPLELKRAFEVEAEIEEAACESESLLHTSTSRLILVGNDALVGLRGLVGGVIDERLGPLASLLKRLEHLAKPNSFHDLLVAFATHFQRDHWKSLWAEIGMSFKSRPEEIAQAVLAAFLQGRYGDVAFVGRELGNGDGYVDVLVNFLGTDHVVEVKIIGASWSIGSAKAGLNQLDEYVQNYNAASAYLLVFDGRKSAKGEQLDAEYPLKSGGTTRVVVVRSFFEAPSLRK